MVTNKRLLVIPCLTLIVVFMNMELDIEIRNTLTFLNKSEASELKTILLWNTFRTKGLGSIMNNDLKFPISFEKLGCPQHRCIVTNKRYFI